MITVHNENGTYVVNVRSISGVYISDARGTVTLITEGEDIDVVESAEEVIDMIKKEKELERMEFTTCLAKVLFSYGIGR